MAERELKAIELFAGVGGFRVGLERAGWEVIWANQWEPSTKKTQHAYECYIHHCGDSSEHSDKPISEVPASMVRPRTLK